MNKSVIGALLWLLASFHGSLGFNGIKPRPKLDLGSQVHVHKLLRSTAASDADLQSPAIQGIYRGKKSTSSPRLGSPLPNAPSSTIIVGAGPAGLATAIMLARRGWQNIQVFDRLAPPPDPDDEAVFGDTARFYLIGLSSRGQKALQALDAWGEVQRYTSAVVGRKDWSGGGAPQSQSPKVKVATDKPYLTAVLARDRLAGVLGRLCVEEYGDQVTVTYGVECVNVAWGEVGGGGVGGGERGKQTGAAAAAAAAKTGGGVGEAPRVTFSHVVDDDLTGIGEDGKKKKETTNKEFTVAAPFLVGADGAARAVAAGIEEMQNPRLMHQARGAFASARQRLRSLLPPRKDRVAVTRFVDDNVRVYKTVPLKLPEGATPPATTALEAVESVAGNEAALERAKDGSAAAAAKVARAMAAAAKAAKAKAKAEATGGDVSAPDNAAAAVAAVAAFGSAAAASGGGGGVVDEAGEEEEAAQAEIRPPPRPPPIEASAAATTTSTPITPVAAAATAALAAKAALKAARERFEWRCDVNYSCRSADSRLVFDALPASRQGHYCGVLLLREDDELAQPNCDPSVLRAALQANLPSCFSNLLDDATVAAIAKKPPSRLPSFRFVGPRLHVGKSTVLLGDAIHTVKPYFGLGANSALEDVLALQKCLDDSPLDDPSVALKRFSDERAPEAKALVRMSRGFDRPGKFGFLTFVLPLILDGLFHKWAPRIFGPNTLAALQQEGATFSAVARKKRRDRALQAALLAVGLGCAGVVATAALKLLVQTAVKSVCFMRTFLILI